MTAKIVTELKEKFMPVIREQSNYDSQAHVEAVFETILELCKDKYPLFRFKDGSGTEFFNDEIFRQELLRFKK